LASHSGAGVLQGGRMAIITAPYHFALDRLTLPAYL